MSKEKVEIELTANSAKLKAEFDAARARVARFKTGVKDAINELGGLGRVLTVAAVGAGLKSAITDATDLGETVSKSRQIFKEHSAEMESWSKGLADSFGQAQASALGAAAEFGAVFDVLGMGQEQSAEMSKKLVELASDMASFNNTSVEQALGAISAGLRGESEPLRKYAVLLNEATLKQEAMEMGLYDGKGTLDMQAKALASYNVILNQTSAAQGDFGRTADQAANSQRILQARLKNISAELGAVLLPIYVASLRFVTDHNKAIMGLVGAIMLYKGAKFALALAKDLAAVVRTGMALLVSKAATDAETAAVARNTAAHAANAVARNTAAASGKGGVAGNLIGAAMGKAAAAKFGLGFLAKFSPHLIAAGIGAAIGKPAGDYLAKKMAESFDEGMRKANTSTDALLASMHQSVTTAKTVEDTTAARARITEEISKLERENLTLGKGLKKEANEHAIAVLKLWDKTADTHRLRGQQLEVEADMTAEYELQYKNQQFIAAQSELAREAEMKRAAAIKEATAAMRESIASLKTEITNEQIDLLPPEKKIDVFTKQLQDGLKRAVDKFNFGRAGQGLDLADGSSETLAGLYALAQKAQKEGNDGLANSLLEQVRNLQKIQAEIERSKNEVASNAKEKAQKELEATKERLAKEKEIAEVKRSQTTAKNQLGEELAVLRLQASGEMQKAEMLQKQLRLRREAAEIAEATGVSEAEAFKIARMREALKSRAYGVKASSESDGGKEGRPKRKGVLSAQESLQRRLERRSKADQGKKVDGLSGRNADLGERFVRDAEAKRGGPLTAVLKGNDVVPGKLDQLITLEEKMVKVFENVIKV
jgi:hypothetical protein